MLNLFKNLFGKSHDLKDIYAGGAIILDVRTPGEFSEGHIEGARNIPVDRLKSLLNDLKRESKPVITCCRSGARSGIAYKLLSQSGIEAYNGDPWPSLEKAIR